MTGDDYKIHQNTTNSEAPCGPKMFELRQGAAITKLETLLHIKYLCTSMAKQRNTFKKKLSLWAFACPKKALVQGLSDIHNGCRGQDAKSFTGESRPRATSDARNAASISKQQSQQALAGFSQASPWVNLWEQTNQAKDEHQHAKHHPCHGTESYEYII